MAQWTIESARRGGAVTAAKLKEEALIRKRLVLSCIARGYTRVKAARAAGVAVNTINSWLCDPEFHDQFRAAMVEGVDHLEDVAVTRATVGVQRPVYQGGAHVGDITEYSDSLLMFLMRGRRPEVYGQKVAVTNNKQEPLTREQAESRLKALGFQVAVFDELSVIDHNTGLMPPQDDDAGPKPIKSDDPGDASD
jgi:hypothetical protein